MAHHVKQLVGIERPEGRSAVLALAHKAMTMGTFPEEHKTATRLVWESMSFDDGFAVAGLTEDQSLELGRFLGVDFV